jgi:hypothetical protein
MLEEAAREGNACIVSWLPNGIMAFRIHRRKDFAERILPRYFRSSNIRSFLRQLNIYDFARVKDPRSEAFGSYSHPLFVHGNPNLCCGMKRTKTKNASRINNDTYILEYHKQSTENEDSDAVTTMIESSDDQTTTVSTKMVPEIDVRIAGGQSTLTENDEEEDHTSYDASYNPFDDSGWDLEELVNVTSNNDDGQILPRPTTTSPPPHTSPVLMSSRLVATASTEARSRT